MVVGENKMLRTLLNKHGVNNDNIEAYLQSSAGTTAGTSSRATSTGPSALETLETLLESRRPRNLDPDCAFWPEPRRTSGDGNTEPEQDSSLACIATTRSSSAAQTGGMLCPPPTTSVTNTSGADQSMFPVNPALSSLSRDPVGLQAFIFDANGQPFCTSVTQHAQQQTFPPPMQCVPTTLQLTANLLRDADESSLITAAEIVDVLDDSGFCY